MRMGKADTQKLVKLEVVIAKKGSLSDVSCIYSKAVIDALHNPDKFVYKSAKEIKGLKDAIGEATGSYRAAVGVSSVRASAQGTRNIAFASCADA